MAGVSTPTPSDGSSKKSVDFELNLVPFIDLLSVLLAFLLATAVWVQVARIDVKPKPTLAGETEPEKDAVKVAVEIGVHGYTVRFAETSQRIEKQGDAYDVAALARALASVRGQHPGERAVTVTSEDRIPYQALITVMDTCLAYGFDGITVGGIDT